MKICEFLEEIYIKYNKKEFLHPDPLEYLFDYTNKSDIEIAGIIASTFAMGRVEKILEAIKKILNPLGKNLNENIKNLKKDEIEKIYKNFRYRFFKGNDVTKLILGIKKIKQRYEFIEDFFYDYLIKNENELLKAIDQVILKIEQITNCSFNFMLPKPSKGSTCKRLFMFMRWMVRKDEIDTGIWSKFNKSNLIVPLDTHMNQISKKIFNLKNSETVNLKRSIEVTNKFKICCPEDPIKYDFALTRFGINRNLSKEDLYQKYNIN